MPNSLQTLYVQGKGCMTNNFSTIKNRLQSEKFLLMRIKPGRSIKDSLVLSSGTTYTMTWPFETLASIELNGVEATLVNGVPGSEQYSFNSTTRLITINLGVAIAAYASGNIVGFHYLFYTNSRHRSTYQDPEDSSTTVR